MVRLQPDDKLSQQLLADLTPPSSTGPAPAAVPPDHGGAPASSVATPSTPLPTNLTGDWKANGAGNTLVALDLEPDGHFMWSAKNQGPAKSFSGTYTAGRPVDAGGGPRSSDRRSSHRSRPEPDSLPTGRGMSGGSRIHIRTVKFTPGTPRNHRCRIDACILIPENANFSRLKNGGAARRPRRRRRPIVRWASIFMNDAAWPASSQFDRDGLAGVRIGRSLAWRNRRAVARSRDGRQ